MPAPRHKPTDDNRKIVRNMRICGYNDRQIARVLGMNKATLSRHYFRELKLAHIELNVELVQCLVDQARNGHFKAATYLLEKGAPAFTPADKLEEVTGPVPITINLPESQWDAVADGGPLSLEITTESD